jgi:PEP-CTERM motif
MFIFSIDRFGLFRQENRMKTRLASIALLVVILSTWAAADTVSMVLVASYNKGAYVPFGLAWDGSSILWSSGGGTLYHMNPNTGVDTASVYMGRWSALGYSGGILYTGTGSTLESRNPVTGAFISGQTMNGISGYGLIDGLDVDGSNIWFSPDVGNVYLRDGSGNAVAGYPNPFLGGGGGYSGVEQVTVGGNTYIIVVNDATQPRKLCIHNFDASATLIGCTEFANQRYEDLAFDGRYLWAADYYGGHIDKIDLLVNGNPILNSAPEPGSMVLLGSGLFGLAGAVRRRLGK